MLFPRFRGLCLRPLVLCSLLATANAGAVTPEEKAGARAAAESGGEAFEAGRYAEAVDYFTRAESLVHAPPHLLYIARAELKLGNLVAAREAYLRVDQEELPPGSPQVFRDAQKMARDELATLEPRIPYVSVVVQGAGSEPVEVFRDEQPIPRALVGIPQPTDPGEHSFYAKAPGMASSVQKVVVKERTKETVLLTLNPTADAANGGATSGTPAPNGAADGGEPNAVAADSGGTNGMKIAGYSALGLGALGLGLGTVFLIQGLDSFSQSDAIFAECPRGSGGGAACSESQQEDISRLDDEGSTQSTFGYVGLGVGVAAAATGVLLLLLDDDGGEAAKSANLKPLVGWGTVGLAGTF